MKTSFLAHLLAFGLVISLPLSSFAADPPQQVTKVSQATPPPPAGSGTAAVLPSLVITPSSVDGVYATGTKVTWTVDPKNFPSSKADATYEVLHAGKNEIDKGTLNLSQGKTTVSVPFDRPGTLVLKVTVTIPGQKDLIGRSGAVVRSHEIMPSAPAPADFDKFWSSKLAELAKVPADPHLVSAPSDKPGVDYWKITMSNIKGTKIQGQIARPHDGTSFPAMLVFQWAGVYPLRKEWVTDMAKRGWLVMNIMAHDLPIDESIEFYKDKDQHELKGYTHIGRNDRETCYFLRMFLACSRSVDYISGRPDWNHGPLVVTGNSQGGFQSFAAAGLNPKVTAVMTSVPAGFDFYALDAGRQMGWPWLLEGASPEAKIAAGYFDAINFAAKIHCPVLVSFGLIDGLVQPEGSFAGINALKGPVETIVVPNRGHESAGYDAYYKRLNEWTAAMLAGKPVPPKP